MLGWDIGQVIKFDCRNMNWQDWAGTLKTCENPQVKAFDYIVRIHYIETTIGGGVIAYGFVVADLSYEDKKQEVIQAIKPERKKAEIDYRDMIRSNIRGMK